MTKVIIPVSWQFQLYVYVCVTIFVYYVFLFLFPLLILSYTRLWILSFILRALFISVTKATRMSGMKSSSYLFHVYIWISANSLFWLDSEWAKKKSSEKVVKRREFPFVIRYEVVTLKYTSMNIIILVHCFHVLNIYLHFFSYRSFTKHFGVCHTSFELSRSVIGSAT